MLSSGNVGGVDVRQQQPDELSICEVWRRGTRITP